MMEDGARALSAGGGLGDGVQDLLGVPQSSKIQGYST
jgi:hypothetical protein